MNRNLLASVLVFALVGCAANVDEPTPGRAPEEPQRPAPQQPLVGQIGQDPSLGSINVPSQVPNVAAPPELPLPGPSDPSN